jgi:hypothetical protein
MSEQTSAIYFTGSNGAVWDNYTIGNALTGGGSGTQTATALLLKNASSATLNWNISVELQAIDGPLAVSLKSIDLIFPDGTVKNLYTTVYGGCTFPFFMLTAPFGNAGSFDLTPYISQYAGQNVKLIATVCGYPGSTNITWSMTAFIIETAIVTPAIVNVNVSGPNGTVSGATVVMNDTSTGQSYTGHTNSSGNVSFNEFNVGDDIAMKVETAGYNTVSETISVAYAVTNVSVTMTAVAFGIPADLASAGKYILVAAGVIGGVAVTYELAKAVKNRERRPVYGPE